VGSHRRCHHVGHVGISLGQVRREVHLLPPIFFFDLLHPGKPEIPAHALPLHEINYAVCLEK
jgi:hypothetical protein